MVMQQLLFKNMQKCTYAYGGWSIFTEKCTPAVTSLAIKVIAYFCLKNEKAYYKYIATHITEYIATSSGSAFSYDTHTYTKILGLYHLQT